MDSDRRDQTAPRVLLGNLRPILALGLQAVLDDDGATVVGRERVITRIVAAAQRLAPDVLVLDRDDGDSRLLCVQVRRACPDTKVILWARDESVMEVVEPSGMTRLVPASTPDDLRREVAAGRKAHANRVEE